MYVMYHLYHYFSIFCIQSLFSIVYISNVDYLLITRFKFFFNFTFILLNSVYKMDVNTKRCLPETVSKDGTAIKRSKVILSISIYSFFSNKMNLVIEDFNDFFSYISGVLSRKVN